MPTAVAGLQVWSKPPHATTNTCIDATKPLCVCRLSDAPTFNVSGS